MESLDSWSDSIIRTEGCKGFHIEHTANFEMVEDFEVEQKWWEHVGRLLYLTES